MMREIKFRAWEHNSKKMYYDLAYITMNGLVMSLNPERPLINTELMQFTGLHDRNGVEIYERDILKDDKGKIYKIVWGNDLLWLAITNEKSCNCYCPRGVSKRAEVVGNIHENPELLEAP